MVTLLSAGSKTLTIVTSEPFDKELVGKIAADMGEITLLDDQGFRQRDESGRPGSGPQTGTPGNTETKKGGIVISEKENGTTREFASQPDLYRGSGAGCREQHGS